MIDRLKKAMEALKKGFGYYGLICIKGCDKLYGDKSEGSGKKMTCVCAP